MKKLFIVIVVVLLLSVGLFYYIHFSANEKKFDIIFFDVGQGDATLVRFEDGSKMLVDCGPDRTILKKLGQYLPFYDRTIDYLLITHPDNDHYGGCVDVLRRYQVKNIITNSDRKPDDTFWQTWRFYEENEDAKIFIIDEPQIFEIGNNKIEFIYPDTSLILSSAGDTSNNQSLVFRLVDKSVKVLFTGDIEESLENALIKKYCSITNCPFLSADILKVAHHGSDTSSSEEFLNASNPKAAVISVGQNRFGHPSLRVLKKMERLPVIVLRTDEYGDITFDKILKTW
ncbi:MAG: hypothetical protein COU29_00470 [Candidatus Magasanikbacteria bacterium CG10_big_fil_rev_8_21_14_0_10_36_32]|uniref:Metallo-beta-lactamase domain-containing protein n=1 Tax=Candidatus Magasanikbacteria bacterium CG10_big_fil_rev_8_21_14_0_10_36_32 TaxID=1974646 RepID=A0A2M6W7F4_9BACT|nr:MAG: hypothetical protein COU29_00470 [Candidatus Magasanikbacteria bacterium CG10_big_fil_rev_8_21_14_0_10_36_32]